VRIAVFTADPSLEQTAWWPTVLQTPGLSGVLLCRQRVSRRPRDVLRRLRRNIAKHGLLFIPYRLGLLVASLARRLRPAPPRSIPSGAPAVPTESIESLDLHSAPMLERVRQWQPDLGLSIGAPVLRAGLFQIPRIGTLNLHLGRVPDFRGAPPGFWELYTGAKSIGATVHWIDAGLDTGPVVAAAEAAIYEADTLARVEARAHELGHRVLAAALGQVAAGMPRATPQAPGGRTFRFPTVKQRAILTIRLALRRWGRRLRDVRGAAKAATAVVWLLLYRPVRDLVRTLRRRHPVRLFTFHRVTDLCRDGMTASPDVFRRQVMYVRRYHEIVSLDRALEALRVGARLARPLAVLAFDDGYRSMWDFARPILAQARLPACCFVCTGLVGTNERLPHDDGNPVRALLDLMSWDQLHALREEGWTVGAHTISHARLAFCTGETLQREVAEPAAVIRTRLGQPDVVLAYPFGGPADISEEGRSVARASGYAACLSNFGGENHPPTDLMEVRRIDIGGDHADLAWKVWVHGWDFGRWLVRWARAFAQGPSSNRPAAA
jgi:peptidoglycan/xylan/chitin deacetylase (PgdA/CDA1 family)/folate-dependent phosphoribosylglycinamide formyltransferase PurN